MKTKTPEPNFQTPDDLLNAVEKAKLASDGVRGHLHDHFRDLSAQDVVEETEQLAKSHGIYLEYNRAKTGKEKDWMYMVRVSVPGGGSFNRAQWATFDEIADQYTVGPNGKPSIRLTTRQNIQYHWIKKADLVHVVRDIASTRYYTLNGCGDNVRNIMGCPLSKFSKHYDANAMAHRFADYFRLPAEPHIQIFEIDTSLIRTPDQRFDYGDKLLNRKFKMAFSAVHFDQDSGTFHYDNCVELRTNEVGVAPIVNPRTHQVDAFQIYIGGGQGEKNGKTTFAAMGQPFARCGQVELHQCLDAIVSVQKEWGDRENRHWARMKYLVHAKGISWYQDRVREKGANFEQPDPQFDPGPRMMHHGWSKQPSNGLWAYGVYIENGRIINGENGELKTMARYIMDHYPVEAMITPNQDLMFTNITDDMREPLLADLQRFGHGKRKGKAYSTLRLLSGACVGLDTCRLSYTESEQFEPELIDQLDDMGYGHLHESIGITGCERQCFRPATKTLGWIGQGPDMYALKIGGSEDGRHQGFWLTDGEKWYLRQVARKEVATVCAVLFDWWTAQRTSGEDLGAFLRRVGNPAVIAHLKAEPRTTALMVKTADAPYNPVACHV